MNNDGNKVVQDDEVDMNENNELVDNIDTQEESMLDDSDVISEEDVDSEMDENVQSPSTQDDSVVKDNWIEVVNGEFTCSECENTSVPETNTVDGTVPADTAKIQQDLLDSPTKIVYGSCPVCGMEYVFKSANSKLYMEPSDMLK